MKKLDKLVLSSFIGPFILTFAVVVFILLTQHMLKYFDDIIGKGLGFDVIGQLLFYFAIFMTPIAMPLAVLLSSLIAFGNLGEHFELTAVKSAGISLLRTIQPIFFFVVVLTGVAFYVNNNLVPKAALEAYSLLYDIKQKKPALDLREGSFYNGIPDISIKVNKKFPDGITLKDIVIYDHRKHDGNKDVTSADSGKMYTIYNERYLKLELFNGYNYTEGSSTDQELAGKKQNAAKETLSRSKFDKTQVIFDLSSFQLERTDKKWFQGNRIMRNLGELTVDVDSIDREMKSVEVRHYQSRASFFNYIDKDDSLYMPEALKAHHRELSQHPEDLGYTPVPDSAGQEAANRGDSIVQQTDSMQERFRSVWPRRKRVQNKSVVTQNPENKTLAVTDTSIHVTHLLDSVLALPASESHYSQAASKARMVKNEIESNRATLQSYLNDRKIYQIQWHKIIASSLACIVMFLIGAPLGAIIKKGGLGVPFLVSILFFIIYYLLTMTGEKWAKQGIIDVISGVWAADVVLLGIGLVFLRQARIDARLFEADFYNVLLDKARQWLKVSGQAVKA
jgi:lipopolysaccharide export system permease protein